MDYHKIPVLSDVYFEDSYVLAVHECDDKIVFDLDIVLTENHPSYFSPQEKEQHCYRKASLIFSDINFVEWSRKRFIRFSDAAGENDYGNIDSFFKDGACYFLEGDWGQVKIQCASIDLAFDN